MADNAPDPDAELVDDEGNPMDVDDLGAKEKVMHKSKSRIIGGLKKMSKRVAGIGADVTVDGVKKQVGGKVDRLIWGDMLKDDGDPECKFSLEPPRCKVSVRRLTSGVCSFLPPHSLPVQT